MPVSPPERDRLGQLLAPIVGKTYSVEPLPSGTSGASYLVETDVGRFVAKLFSPCSYALLGPEAQFALLTALAPTGVAPQPAGFDADAGLLVTRFLEDATSVSREALGEAPAIRATAAGLEILHGVAAPIPRYEPAACVERYVESVGGDEALSARDLARRDELLEIAAWFDGQPGCLCHNDLTIDNMLFEDGRLRLIDFDYAVIAPPAVDLASLVFLNGFSEAETSALLDAAACGANPVSRAEFARVERLVRLVAHFWSLASAGTAAGAAIVSPYGIRDD